MTRMLDDRVVALERQNAELRRQLEICHAELEEARAQQAATAEVLQVINSSPGELGPVFEAILDKGLHLCDAAFGSLLIHEGDDQHRIAAVRGLPPTRVEAWGHGPLYFGPGTASYRLVRGERFVHMRDAAEDEGYRSGNPLRRALVDIDGARTWLGVPLRREGVLLGAFAIYRREVRPFSDEQITLLESFAAQAVIAMENARLLTETGEALEQQTATAEVLGVISSCPGELQPVFDAMLGNAGRLCDCVLGGMFLYQGGGFLDVAMLNVTPDFATIWRREASHPAPTTALARLVQSKKAVQIDDLMLYEGYTGGEPLHVSTVDVFGARTVLAVPMLKESQLLGAIVLFRREPLSFSEKQLALVSSFASQAVIAIENARLITETREALEQQTATAEVLQVINSSPGDLAPVFDAMLEKATRLCDAPYGQLAVYDGELFRFVAVHGESRYAEQQRRDPIPPSYGVTWLRIVGGAAIVHIADVLEDPGYFSTEPSTRALVDASGMRTVLTVALRKDEVLLGVLTVYRQEVRPFSEKQIALLQNFAAQAVIAMENARLLTEQREALERQAATAEVLGIIASSPARLEPVFEAMLANAVRICAGTFGTLALYDGDGYRGVAAHGAPSSFPDTLSRFRRPVPGTTLDGLEKTLRTVQLADCAAEPAYDPVRAANPEYARVRSHLCTPMIKDNRLLGAILIYRDRVQPFDDKQIELVENFAKQAVIAIENARLISETREALEQQTATAEVLQVINSSPGDLAPVFDAMLEKATRLAEASFGILMTYDGECFRPVGLHGVPQAFGEYLRTPLRPARSMGLVGC